MTQADLNYIGSISLDPDLIEAAGLVEGERVQIVNINNGERLETYVITGETRHGSSVPERPRGPQGAAWRCHHCHRLRFDDPGRSQGFPAHSALPRHGHKPPRMTLRKGLTTLVFFGIGVGLFWLAMQGVEDLEALKRDMRSAQWWGIASSFVMGYSGHCVAWHSLEFAARAHGPSSISSQKCARRGVLVFRQCLRASLW